MASIDMLTTAIGAAVDRLREAVRGAAAAHEAAEELREVFEATGAADKAAGANDVAAEIEVEDVQLRAAAENLAAALAMAEALRGNGTGSSVIPAVRPGWKPMRTDPAAAAEIRPYVGESIAYASLYDESGNKLVGVHSASRDGPARDARWHEPWASMPRLRRHVEAHAAARMDRDGHRQVAVYLNLPPCSYPDGCKLNLADLVPRGSTLWVHQVRASGTVDIRRFRGTGRALDG